MHDQRDRLALGRLGQLEHAGLAAQRALYALLDVAQDRLALALGEPRVDGHRGSAEQQAAVQRLDERQPGLQHQRDRLPTAHAAHVQRAGGADRAQQQLAVGDRLAGRRDGDAVGMAPRGARQPVSQVHG